MFKLRKLKIAMALCIIVSFSLLIIFFLDYQVKIKNQFLESMLHDLEKETQYNAEMVNSYFDHAVEEVRNYAIYFSKFENVHCEESLDMLNHLKADSSFNTLRITNLNGESIGAGGSIINISGRQHFYDALNGHTTVSNQLNSLFDGKSVFVVCTPIIRDGHVNGVMNATIDAERIEDLINDFAFDGHGYVSIADKTGKFMATTRDKDYNLNLFNELETRFIVGSLNQMIHDFNSDKSGFVSYELSGDIRYLHYTPVGVNDWYLLQIVNQKYVDTIVGQVNETTALLLSKVIFLLSIVMIIIMINSYADNQINKENSRKMSNLINAIPGGVSETTFINGKYTILFLSKGVYKLAGYHDGEKSFNLLKVIYPDDYKKVQKAISDSYEYEKPFSIKYRILKKNAEIAWIQAEGKVIRSLTHHKVIETVYTDLTDEMRSINRFKRLSEVDKMTNLLDKVTFKESMEEVLYSNRDGKGALINLDVDDFKFVNDTYGHLKGDDILISLANVLKVNFRSYDLIGRMGGDEFCIMLNDFKDDFDIEKKIKDLLEAVGQIKIDNKNSLRISVGICVFSYDDQYSYETIYKHSDKQLYKAKQSGKNNYSIVELKNE